MKIVAANTYSDNARSKFKSGFPPRTFRIIALMRKETPPGLSAADIAARLQLEESCIERALSELSSIGAIKKEGRLLDCTPWFEQR